MFSWLIIIIDCCIWFRTDKDFYPPCEMAVAEFTLERGVTRVWQVNSTFSSMKIHNLDHFWILLPFLAGVRLSWRHCPTWPQVQVSEARKGDPQPPSRVRALRDQPPSDCGEPLPVHGLWRGRPPPTSLCGATSPSCCLLHPWLPSPQERCLQEDQTFLITQVDAGGVQLALGHRRHGRPYDCARRHVGPRDGQVLALRRHWLPVPRGSWEPNPLLWGDCQAPCLWHCRRLLQGLQLRS